MHIVGVTSDAEHGNRLVGSDDQLEAGPPGVDQLCPTDRMAEPSRPEPQPVRLRRHLTGQPERRGAGATHRSGVSPRPP